jgi:acetate kinase
MSDVILALNAGSSSIKFSLFVTTGRGDALSLELIRKLKVDHIDENK